MKNLLEIAKNTSLPLHNILSKALCVQNSQIGYETQGNYILDCSLIHSWTTPYR